MTKDKSNRRILEEWERWKTNPNQATYHEMQEFYLCIGDPSFRIATVENSCRNGPVERARWLNVERTTAMLSLLDLERLRRKKPMNEPTLDNVITRLERLDRASAKPNNPLVSYPQR